MTKPARTSLYPCHLRLKGRMVDFAGWEMPVQYTSIVTEHEAVRGGLGLFDVSHMGRLEFQGEDAMDLLQRATTNDVCALADGQVQYSLMCDDLGGVIDDVLVYRISSDRWAMVCNASNRGAVLARLRELNHRAARIDDRTESTAMIAAQGPAAVRTITKLVDTRADELGYYRFRDLLHEGKPSRLSRTGYTGEDGFEWTVPAELAVSAWDSLIADGGVPCGLGARDTLRLEAAMPLYGHELAPDVDPFSAGLGKFVVLNKCDFAGREALSRIASAPPRRRVGLVIEGKRPARQGTVVLAGSRPIGVVTSGTFSPTLQKAIAMALIDRSLPWPLENGLGVDIRGTIAAASATRLPFYRRMKE